MRLQENISALWICTDHKSKHSTAADWTELCLGLTMLSLENRKFGTDRWCLAWRSIFQALSHFLFVMLVMKLLFLPFCSAVYVLGPEAKSLVGSYKSRLGLAHCWGWLRFATEPQPNSPSTVRRRSVYSPEPWPTSCFTVGLHARDSIPFPLLLYHPLPSFGSHLFVFLCVFPVEFWGLAYVCFSTV